MIKLTRNKIDKSIVMVNEKYVTHLYDDCGITVIFFGRSYVEVNETIDEVLKIIEDCSEVHIYGDGSRIF